jgi:hypothetical protein
LCSSARQCFHRFQPSEIGSAARPELTKWNSSNFECLCNATATIVEEMGIRSLRLQIQNDCCYRNVIATNQQATLRIPACISSGNISSPVASCFHLRHLHFTTYDLKLEAKSEAIKIRLTSSAAKTVLTTTDHSLRSVSKTRTTIDQRPIRCPLWLCFLRGVFSKYEVILGYSFPELKRRGSDSEHFCDMRRFRPPVLIQVISLSDRGLLR